MTIYNIKFTNYRQTLKFNPKKIKSLKLLSYTINNSNLSTDNGYIYIQVNGVTSYNSSYNNSMIPYAFSLISGSSGLVICTKEGDIKEYKIDENTMNTNYLDFYIINSSNSSSSISPNAISIEVQIEEDEN